ncbi:MAG TPA: hypothetical protein VJ549_00975 [Geothrix sp.]|nr:hypothetical protein [Geothrix sp.]
MTDTFRTRIPALSDSELRRYLQNHLEYRTEAVTAALDEAARRGLQLPEGESARIEASLAARDAAAQAQLDHSFVKTLGRTPESRLRRVRQITLGILAAGFGTAAILYLRTAPGGANPLGYEPEDTKKYLRDLELYGGKVNVLATEFMRWWDGLWHGRNLAFTVAWLTTFAAAAFWLIAHRRAMADLRAAAPKD